MNYRLVELPFFPTLIHSTGVVAGTNEARRGVIWKPSSGLEILNVPEGFHYTDPAGFTQSGELVVNAADKRGKRRQAFLYSKQSMLPLEGKQTRVHAVGPSGIAVGEWVPSGSVRTDPVYWDPAKHAHSIPLCCGGLIKAANRKGEMIGNAYDEQGRYHAFLWSPTEGARTLEPTESFSSALAIDDAGHVLFTADKQTYLIRNGAPEPLELSSQFENSPQAMNNCDFVVGGFGPFSDSYRAFLWTPDEGFQDLNQFMPQHSPWTLQLASAINDRGEIVGIGEVNGEDRGFLLVPSH